MFFLFTGTDKANRLELRMKTKATHKLYLDSAPSDVEVLFSGPLVDADGRESGSAIVFRAVDKARLRAFLDDEPYHRAGLYARSEIRQWLWRRGNPYL